MKRHSFDVISAGFALLFIWVGISELIPDVDLPISTVWPILAVAGGVALLLTALQREQEVEQEVDATEEI